MHVLVTGASGLIGSHVMVRLLEAGHSITATDILPLSDTVLARIGTFSSQVLAVVTGDLTKPTFVDQLFSTAEGHAPVEGVMHIGGIRSPAGLDPRLVHNTNTTASYNVLQTAAARGVTRIVQASSCNALGLSWTSDNNWRLDFVPINETHPMRPVSFISLYLKDTMRLTRKEDPYSLSKLICEEQAASMARLYPSTRIASIRMHFTRSADDTAATPKKTGLWSWSSVDAVVRACILGLTSPGWSGAEAFHIAASEIAYPLHLTNGVESSALDLLEKFWPGRVGHVDTDWWKGNPKRSFFDTRKAETLLGWKHDIDESDR